MKAFLLFCFLGFAHTLMADPPVGIAVDSKGNIFYTDLTHVWMIKPDGTKTIAVPNVHTHELYLNKNDELFGEHLWFDDSKKNPWAYYLWRRNAHGTIIRLKDTTAGFADWTSFVRDDAGNSYLVEKSIPSLFWKTDTTGKKTLLGSASLSGIGRLHLTQKGDLFFSNKADLYYIPAGDRLQLFLKDAGTEGLGNGLNSDAHVILSTWSDNEGNIYIATGAIIKKITNKKFATVIYKSAGDWKPCGGLVTITGDFWVMEYNSKNEVRVNKISKEDRKKIINENTVNIYVIPLVLIIAVSVGLYFLFRKKNN